MQGLFVDKQSCNPNPNPNHATNGTSNNDRCLILCEGTLKSRF